MYMLVYVSSAVKLFGSEELTELLEKSRKNNSALGITGMLLYKDGNFMQFLEGPKEAVLGLLNKVKDDPRHRGLIVMLQEDHNGREFEQWAMAFKMIDSNTAFEVPGYSEFLDLPLTSDQFLLNPSRTLKLLLSFKKTVG
jgi:Sensors of blue-light using FAD